MSIVRDDRGDIDMIAGRARRPAIADSDRIRTETSLKLANQELEAFSFSIDNDLRAPLRAVSGTAAILTEKCARLLDTDALDCLEEIRTSAVAMGALIEGLLILSNITRSELKPDLVDLGALAREVGAELRRAEPGRSVQLVVQDGLKACCDPLLARTLMANLLANAWRFTSKCVAPRIDVGSADNRRVRAFFVRDNGAGLDMTAAGKLFPPAQRLPTAAHLAGTGIGLATAQRIVHRHGGHIWAEGRIDAGAVVYFTLPPASSATAPP